MRPISVTNGTMAGAQVPLRHSWHVDADEPQYVTDPARPHIEAGVNDLRGCGCAVRPYVFRNGQGHTEAVVMEHRPGCAWFQTLAAQSKET